MKTLLSPTFSPSGFDQFFLQPVLRFGGSVRFFSFACLVTPFLLLFFSPVFTQRTISSLVARLLPTRFTVLGVGAM